ncbi:MAG: hypothetical protein QM668_17910 [Agriterribacter sp.]
MKRKRIREVLQGKYEINDEEFDGTALHRDVYNQLNRQSVFLFLNYDNNNCFSELEIHKGIDLKIFDRTINFEMLFWDAVEMLNKDSSNQSVIDEGEVLFIDLQLSLCSCASMGGDQEDNRLSYIYCAQNISHLLD